MATAHAEPTTSGSRGNLTPSQSRALFRLWQRFFRLCEMPAGSLSDNVDDASAVSSSHAKTNKNDVRAANEASTATLSSGTNLSRSKSHPTIGPSVPPSSSAQSVATAGFSKYGKPLQRQVSNVRQIDERGSHIPKDDRVKDELKTLEEAKEMREFLERYGGERLRQIFWEMVKGEHPDAVMLRFLRARKWNVDRAIAVIGSTAAFRADNDVMGILRGGELALTQTRGGMNMLANGISYIYGATSIGEPVYFIEVGNHYSHNQTQQELKKGVIFLQELLQLLMPPPIERKVVIFNMNDFGIRNMDWWCVFFMVKTMESYYVETLSRVYVHGAPWIFKPIWAILKPLLDPVVRDKIRLTFSAEELAEHVPFNHLPKDSMRGGMDWKFTFPPPDPQENDVQLDTETRDRLHAEYMAVAADFERATVEVSALHTRASLLRRGGVSRAASTAMEANRRANADIHDTSLSSDEDDGNDEDLDSPAVRLGRRGSAVNSWDHNGNGIAGGSVPTDDGIEGEGSLRARRDVLATKLRLAFLRLKPYVVGKSMVDRWGVMHDDGRLVWQYRSLDGEVEEQVLGEGTTLPELERNLAAIEEALALSDEQATSAAKDNGGGVEVEKNDGDSDGGVERPAVGTAALTHSKMPSWSPRVAETGQMARVMSSSSGQHGEMNRRQQRLRNRSRPAN